jgi:hypothetical protein
MDKALVTLLAVFIVFIAVATVGLGVVASRGSDTCCCTSEE